MEFVWLVQVALETTSRLTATSTDRCRHSRTTDSPLEPPVQLAQQPHQGAMARPQLQLLLEVVVDENHRGERPFASSACGADRAAELSCPARSALWTCRSWPCAAYAAGLRQVRRRRVFLAHHAKQRHCPARSPSRDATIRTLHPLPHLLRRWGCDSPRSRLISLARHDTRSARP